MVIYITARRRAASLAAGIVAGMASMTDEAVESAPASKLPSAAEAVLARIPEWWGEQASAAGLTGIWLDSAARKATTCSAVIGGAASTRRSI
jgi:hypothetical protein